MAAASSPERSTAPSACRRRRDQIPSTSSTERTTRCSPEADLWPRWVASLGATQSNIGIVDRVLDGFVLISSRNYRALRAAWPVLRAKLQGGADEFSAHH